VRAGLAGAFLLASAGAVRAQGPIVWPDATPTGVAATRTCFSENVRLTGYLLPRRETYVTLNIEGYRVAEVLAQEGDTVSAEQELIRLTRLPGDEPPAAAGRGGPPRTLSLRAPAAGIVSRSTARVGTLTRAQGEPLMRLVLDPEIEAIVEVPSLYATRIRPGAPVRVLVENSLDLTGSVRVAATEIDPATQFGRARVSVIPNASLRSGMFVRVLVDTGRSCGVAVPRSALLRQNDATSVQVLKDGKVEPRRVVVGLSSEDKVEIRQGLAEGESVVANASLAF
jgi:multidrug efflux pump subunit AcrA (membrane-fusion protein)